MNFTDIFNHIHKKKDDNEIHSKDVMVLLLFLSPFVFLYYYNSQYQRLPKNENLENTRVRNSHYTYFD